MRNISVCPIKVFPEKAAVSLVLNAQQLRIYNFIQVPSLFGDKNSKSQKIFVFLKYLRQ